MPILAVSGLDHDIKIISEKATDLDGLSEVIEDNVKKRKEDNDYSMDGYDMILSFIMREYRRGLRLAIEPDNPHVFLSCGEDSNVLQVDLREDSTQRNKLVSVRNDKDNRVALYSIFIDPSNYNMFAVSGRDEYARVYDRRILSESRLSDSQTYPDPLEKYCPQHLIPHYGRGHAHMTCLAYSHDGKELLCSYNDEDIYTFDTSPTSSKVSFTKRFKGHRNSSTVKGVNYFGLNSEYVVSGSDCGHVFLWDKESTEVVQYLKGDHEGVVNCLEPHPHMPILAVSGLDHDIKIISPSSEKATDLDGLSEVIEDNVKKRKEDNDYSMDGYDMILSFIMREYRRGLRHQVGIDSDEDTDEDSDEEEEEEEDDHLSDEEEGIRFPRVLRRRQRDSEEGEDEEGEEDERVQCVSS